jgi:hypothetical protein
MQSQLETFRDEQRRGEEGDKQHMEIIRTNLPNITAFCGMKPYDGLYEYEPLKAYIDEAEGILKKRGNQLTLAVDKKISAMVRELGKDAVLQIKNDNFNLCRSGTGARHRQQPLRAAHWGYLPHTTEQDRPGAVLQQP